MNVPTDTLIDMLFAILADEVHSLQAMQRTSNRFNTSCKRGATNDTGVFEPLTEETCMFLEEQSRVEVQADSIALFTKKVSIPRSLEPT